MTGDMTAGVGGAQSALGLLREQLLSLAAELVSEGGATSLTELMAGLVGDVERASAERLEIFPVCHHSPASAVHMLRRLQARAPRVIFVELCEDLQDSVALLKDCRLPVALQAFSTVTVGFPAEWAPLSVVAPVTAFSAEYQAISFCSQNPEVALVFVDRSVDHVFQWKIASEEQRKAERAGRAPEPDDAELEDGPEDEDDLHGTAEGVEVGSTLPTMDRFVELLLKNAHARNWQEWWNQYVEEVVQGSSYSTYREVLFLIGSLIRRLGRRRRDLDADRLRERFMWTRMKAWLRDNGVDAADAIYICGAAHSASEVAEFGTGSDQAWEIPARTKTLWKYGLIPSSYRAIEQQFGLAPGAVIMAEQRWEKLVEQQELTPFSYGAKPARAGTKAGTKAGKKVKPPLPLSDELTVGNFMLRPPEPAKEDEESVVDFSVRIVAKAREAGYLTSTADCIAIVHTAMLLAGMRNRRQPTTWDLMDAAVTCLEKNRIPKKRNIRRLCEILLGGDRRGLVGETSLPPLAKEVYERLAPLKLNLQASNVQRALINFVDRSLTPAQVAELREASRLLWKLKYLIGSGTFKTIMGEKVLGKEPIQESWDLYVGRNQRAIIELAYEGVSVEHVLERRLRKKGLASDAKTVAVLEAVEDALLYLQSPRLVQDLGEQAVNCMTGEVGADSAQEIFERVRRLATFYRSQPGGLPPWLGGFVATGYQQYCSLLPEAFSDRGTKPAQLAGMLAFLFTLEGLALSMGCNRSQLLIAIGQCQVGDDPQKLGLLWTAEWLLGLREEASIREFFAEVIDNPMRVVAFSDYIQGFLLALGFTPLVAGVVVEVISRAFARLPERVLVTWLPSLLTGLRPLAGSSLPALFAEVSVRFPRTGRELDGWVPPWEVAARPKAAAKAAVKVAKAGQEQAGQEQTNGAVAPQIPPQLAAARRLLFANRATLSALSPGEWLEQVVEPQGAGGDALEGAAGDAAGDAPEGAAGDAPDGEVGAEQAAARRLLVAWPETLLAVSGR